MNKYVIVSLSVVVLIISIVVLLIVVIRGGEKDVVPAVQKTELRQKVNGDVTPAEPTEAGTMLQIDGTAPTKVVPVTKEKAEVSDDGVEAGSTLKIDR